MNTRQSYSSIPLWSIPCSSRLRSLSLKLNVKVTKHRKCSWRWLRIVNSPQKSCLSSKQRKKDWWKGSRTLRDVSIVKLLITETLSMSSNKKKKTFLGSLARPKSTCRPQSTRTSRMTRPTLLRQQPTLSCKLAVSSSNSKKRNKPWRLIISELLRNWNQIKTWKRVFSTTFKTSSGNSKKTKSNWLPISKTLGVGSNSPQSSLLKKRQLFKRWESLWQSRRRRRPC